MAVSKQLYVLRHAKSSWDDPGLDDHERPLAPRGRRAVKLLAAHLRAKHVEPSLVICSPARRARETYDGVAPGGELVIEPDLYGATEEVVLDRLRRVPKGTPSVMVVGHNPQLQELVLMLTGGELRGKFPTGALATLTFGCPWSELSAGGAKLVDFVRPRDLN
jgi:phosphohistidine phosphatase